MNTLVGNCRVVRLVGGRRVRVGVTARWVVRRWRCVCKLRANVPRDRNGKCSRSSASRAIATEMVTRAGRVQLETALHVVAGVARDPGSNAVTTLSEVV